MVMAGFNQRESKLETEAIDRYLEQISLKPTRRG
jgi:hypothetical protein